MESLQNLTELFKNLVGLPAWQVVVAHNQFLSIDFGQPRLELENDLNDQRKLTPRGDWHLELKFCAWTAYPRERNVSETSPPPYDKDFAKRDLDSQILTNFSIELDSTATRFQFDLGASLEFYPGEFESGEQWRLSDQRQIWTLDRFGVLKVRKNPKASFKIDN